MSKSFMEKHATGHAVNIILNNDKNASGNIGWLE